MTEASRLLVYLPSSHSQSKCSHLILKEFKFFEKKRAEYKTFEEFEDDVDLFYAFYMDSCPDFDNRKLIILEFLTKILRETAKFFVQRDLTEASAAAFKDQTCKALQE